MSDIVARLHAMIDANYGDVAADSVYGSAMSDAAAEIERLRALLKEAGEEPITSAEILARPTIPGVVDRNGGGRSA